MLSKRCFKVFVLIVLAALVNVSTSFKRNGIFDLKKQNSKDDNSLSKDEKIGETSVSDVYSSDDDDDDTERSKNYDKPKIISQIKEIWHKHIQLPPSDLSQIDKLAVSTYQFTNNFQDINHADYNTLYQHLLTQFLNPFKTNIYGGGNQWFDRDFILDLKGRAVLAHRSDEILSSMPTNLERKAVRLLCSTKGAGHIQQVLGYALAHSIGSSVILLTKEVIESVRQQCISKGIPKSFLSRGNLVSILFDLVEETKKSTIVLMSGHVKWVLQNEDVSEVFVFELRSKNSKIFIVLTESTDVTAENQIHISSNGNKNNNNNAENVASGNMPDERFMPFPNISAMLPPELMSMFPPMMGDTPFPQEGGNITMIRGTMNIPPEMQQFFQRAIEQQQQQRPDGDQPIMTSFSGMIPIPEEVLKKIAESQNSQLSQYKDGKSNQTNESFEEMINNSIPQEVLQSVMQGIASHIAHMHSSTPVITPDGQVIEIKVHGINIPTVKGRAMVPPQQPPNNPKMPRFFFKGPQNPAQTKNILENVGENGKTFMTLFDELRFEKPKDHKLKLKWDNLINESNGMRIFLLNSKLLHQEIDKYNLKFFDNKLVFEDLKDILQKEILNNEQITEALSLAIKLEAGAVDINNSLHINDFVLHSWSLEIGINLVLKKPLNGKMIRKSIEEMSSAVTDNNEKALLNNVILPQDIGVTYDMIGGLKDVKEILRQSITYPLKYPYLYEEGIAQEAIKGVLLFGPPGTGKTLLAKAVATEGGATFLSIDASTIENKWLGESEKNAKAVFNLARRLAPCVIYLDEVDSILSSREHGDDSSHGTLTSVKTTLMQEWDGLRTTKDRIVVIASTNRPFDLDEAVLRRLPRRIFVDLPDIETRKDILNVTLANNRLSSDVNLTVLADRLEGYTGSDIKEICREAVVSVSHKIAHSLENGSQISDINSISSSSTNETSNSNSFVANKMKNPFVMLRNRNASIKHLRSVNMNDFELAIEKLKASVDSAGTEMSKVIQWNEKYGETKKKKKMHNPHSSMYI